MQKFVLIITLGTAFFTANPARGEQTELGKSLKDIECAPHWIYDDLPRAFKEAKVTGKPILVVLRCVPCPPGSKLDEKVMQPNDELAELEKKFVCVRIIKTNGLDLNLFQFDYDQSWAAMFLNANKVVYGRYGTRVTNRAGSDSHITEPAFRKALQRALEIHKNYPANKEQLAKNIGAKARWPVPEKIPGLQERHKVPVTRKSCIHCHMVREYQIRAKWETNDLKEEDLYVYPMPDNIGMRIDVIDGLLVRLVEEGSPAAKAGVKPGDSVVKLNGLPLTSIADMQWVLHNIPAESKLDVTLNRNGKTVEKTIALSGKWKVSNIAWRASSWYGLRQGLKTEPLTRAAKKERGIAADKLALAVKGLFGKGRQKLTQVGLRQGDVIIAVDGKSNPMTESDFLVYLRTTHGPEDSVTLTVLRGNKVRELKIPMW